MKLKLNVQTGALAGFEFELFQGMLRLGRAADCAARFDDRLVSSYHAVIQSDPNGFYIADQGSRNGTFVNGQQIQNVWLQSGDLIELGTGGPKLMVKLEETVPPPLPPPLPDVEPSGGVSPTDSLRHTITHAGAYNPQRDKPGAGSQRAGLAAAFVIGGILLLIVMGIMIGTLGFGGALIGAIMAFTPAPFYITLFLWLDRYDPEPPWALAGIFAWGALVAIFVSFIINTMFGIVTAALIDPQTGDALSAVISAPIIEEATKGLGVVLIMIFLRREFDGVLDGIVYAGIVGLGFATVENVMYYGNAFKQEGVGSLLLIGFLRGVLSPFIHSFFTAMTGIGCGIARETQRKGMKVLMPVVGYMAAVTLHGMWNAVASIGGLPLFGVLYVLVWVPLFIIFLIFIGFMIKREFRVIRENLAVEVATGLITPQQLELVASFIDRTKWALSVFSDRKRFKARRKFLRSTAKLAYCYWHAARASASGSYTISLPQIPRFKAEVAALQNQI